MNIQAHFMYYQEKCMWNSFTYIEQVYIYLIML